MRSENFRIIELQITKRPLSQSEDGYLKRNTEELKERQNGITV